jgi:ActR/RegA family two-component response regulator
MRPSLLLTGEDIAALAAITAVLDPRSIATHLVEMPRALRHLARAPLPRVDVVVLALDGSENIAEMRTILDMHPDARFVFLTPDYPPSPAVARVCAQHGAVVFPCEEEPIVVGATIVAMLATRHVEAAP